MSDVLQFTAGFAGPATTPLRQAIEYAQTGPFGTQLTADEYIAGGVPVINPTHIQRGHIAPDDSTTVTPEKAEDLARYRLAVGDIVLGRKGEVDKSALVNQQSKGYVCGSDAMALRPRLGTVPDYLWWFLQSSEAHSQLEFWSVGATVSGLNQNTIRKVRLPLPDVQEQQRIANYLDRETARIDTLIEEQKRLIEMLRERRWAVVERGVALLDWNTPFKTVATLIQTGPFGSQLKSDEYEHGGIPVINPSHIVAGEVVPDPRIAVSAAKAEQLARHKLQKGDLITARRGDLGRCAVVGPSAAGFLCGTGSAVVRLDRARVDPSFAAIVFSSRRNRDALVLASVGSTMENLNSDIIGALRVPVPPVDEQRRLTSEMEQARTKIDTLIAETERFVELARERRSALITAAVTGQIDVREML